MAPEWFMILLLGLNFAAGSAFAYIKNWPWAAIYLGAAIIQMGCLAAKK